MKVLREYGFPVARFVWGMTGDSWDKNMTAENFLAKYTPSAQGHLDSHIDDSFTVSGDGNTVFFQLQPKFLHDVEILVCSNQNSYMM